MKYPVFALFALSVFFLADCQNTPATPAAPTTTTSDNTVTPVDEADVSNIPPPPPAANLKALNEQVLTDLIEGRTLSRKYDSTFNQAKALVIDMKHAWVALPEAQRAEVGKLNQDIVKFTVAYYDQKKYSDQLDSLSIKLAAKTINLEEAQADYVKARAHMLSAGQKLTAAKVDLPSWKAQFEGIFSKANQKASGGQK